VVRSETSVFDRQYLQYFDAVRQSRLWDIMNHALVLRELLPRKRLGINRRAWEDYPTYLWKRSAPKQRLRLVRTAQLGIVQYLKLFDLEE
jgi:hypothetical protein